MPVVIEVYPNPYIAVDKDGVPQGTVSLPGSPMSLIGAHLDVVGSQKAGKPRYYFPLGRDGGKCKVHLTAEISHAVQAGELIAADTKSAHVCGVRGKDFLPPDQALAREKERALDYRKALLGPDAKLEDIPREPTPPPTEPTAEHAGAAQLSPTLTLNTEA